VLVKQCPARDLGEELAELRLARSGESPDQHEGCITGRAGGSGRGGIEYLRLEGGEAWLTL
jgi:hypothetical protein